MSVTPMLKEVLAEAGRTSKGAQLILYTASEVLLGLTDDAAWADPSNDGTAATQPVALSELKAGSMTAGAIDAIKAENNGNPCPTEQTFITSGETLIDVTPFRAENFGMPPLNEDWCALSVMPRSNIFESIDAAERASTSVVLIGAAGAILAMMVLIGSIWLESQV